MTPGSPDIRHCLVCNGLVGQHTLNSGNTFGAVYWTDSKREAPMLPQYPDLGRCPHCSVLMLHSASKESNVGGQYFTLPDGVEWLVSPTEDDYLAAIEDKMFDEEDVIGARIDAWHCANDGVRKAEREPQFSEASLANLAALGHLLEKEDAPNALLMRAEIARETGDFGKVLALLDKLTEEDYQKPCEQIRELARQKDMRVCRLQLD